MEEDFNRITRALTFIQDNQLRQPTLAEVADHVALSSFHFQRLFTKWAGISPKKYLQFLTLNEAKRHLLHQKQLLDATMDVGLSGTGRLHDLFVRLEGMTPAEYKTGGKGLVVDYAFRTSYYGNYLVAASRRGICFLGFQSTVEKGLEELMEYLPSATFRARNTVWFDQIGDWIDRSNEPLEPIPITLRGTPFQLKIWEALLAIPAGEVTSYGQIAGCAGRPEAVRAVGTSIGKNPVAFLIPCHRVIRANGEWSNYRWGKLRKIAMLERERIDAMKEHLKFEA